MAKNNLKPWQQFIVPLYGFNSNIVERVFIGTAFIVAPKYLVTAAHNIQGDVGKMYSNKCIEFNGQVIELSNLLASEYNNLPPSDGNYEDIAVFDIGKLVNTKSSKLLFSLSENDVLKDEMYRATYIEQTTSNNSLLVSGNVSIKRTENVPRLYKSKRGGKLKPYYQNCFSVYETLKDGSSGAPIHVNNLVFGMIVYGFSEDVSDLLKDEEKGTKVIKSSYIKKFIDNIKPYY